MSNNGAPNKGKNIVVFADGTGQDGGLCHNTNVYKLFNMVEDRTDEQVTFYDRGLGTGLRKLTGSVLGAGITKNIVECYEFISANYQWGDRIFLFGFSRGATTVRSLSGFISMFGLLPSSRPELCKRAYAIYKMRDHEKRRAAAEDFLRKNSTAYCNIKFLGVWDSVAALGLPNKSLSAVFDRIPFLRHTYHDLKLASCVQHAYHALSIDDERDIFHPTPWHTHDKGKPRLGLVPLDPREGEAAEQEEPDRRQTVRQVWFCGAHTDVGGGYEDHGVADIPLAWMIDKAVEHGLKLYPYNGVQLQQNVNCVIHDSLITTGSKLIYRRRTRSWDADTGGKPVLHASVLQRKRGLVQRPGKQTDKDSVTAVPVAEVPYEPWILRLKEGEYEIEPWDNECKAYCVADVRDYRRNEV